MELKQIDLKFSVCKIQSLDSVDFTREFVFLSKTDDEISLVCETTHVPSNVINVEHGWKALKISGILDFSMIGVISKISSILADNQISVFVISTFNTDYILIKSENYHKALQHLEENGYEINLKY